jgi:hypothetical protein
VCCFDRSGLYSKSLSAPQAATRRSRPWSGEHTRPACGVRRLAEHGSKESGERRALPGPFASMRSLD